MQAFTPRNGQSVPQGAINEIFFNAVTQNAEAGFLKNVTQSLLEHVLISWSVVSFLEQKVTTWLHISATQVNKPQAKKGTKKKN